MGKFWLTTEFKSLSKEWSDKLKESGFKDIESEKGELAQHNRRTIAFHTRDRLMDFFIALDHYLTVTEDLPPKHRKVLELYAEGLHVKGPGGIVEQTTFSRSFCFTVIWNYRKSTGNK